MFLPKLVKIHQLLQGVAILMTFSRNRRSGRVAKKRLPTAYLLYLVKVIEGCFNFTSLIIDSYYLIIMLVM